MHRRRTGSRAHMLLKAGRSRRPGLLTLHSAVRLLMLLASRGASLSRVARVAAKPCLLFLRVCACARVFF